jgi:hypothetical protein
MDEAGPAAQRQSLALAPLRLGHGLMVHRPALPFAWLFLAAELAGERAAMAVLRPAGYGRIILVSSTGGLHGDVGLSAYAARAAPSANRSPRPSPTRFYCGFWVARVRLPSLGTIHALAR